jgi:para-aminobenzoate synthetase component 1
MLNWANQFGILLFLDSNSYQSPYSKYECLLAADAAYITDPTATLVSVQQMHAQQEDWLFGHICYDYKNELESKLSSNHQPSLHFPALQFFCPKHVCYIDKDKQYLHIESLTVTPQTIYDAILATSSELDTTVPKLSFEKKTTKEHYLDTISKLRAHIAEGDCYEINYCCEAYNDNAVIAPLNVFNALNALSPAPFTAYYKSNGNYLLCASPERYLQKTEGRILSQPIKGTARRDADAAKDAMIKAALQQSIKERAENVMIVDLVRNDLARSCAVGSVQVDELMGIYSFPQVHQMISTVSGMLKNGIPFTDAIKYSFPMGSMTGAPKIMVMQLIEKYEQARRELYSGTVGYIQPNGNFDFNVVIRSLFYNQQTQYLSYQTGGAITYDSDAEQEWEEMRLKAWAMERIFS